MIYAIAACACIAIAFGVMALKPSPGGVGTSGLMVFPAGLFAIIAIGLAIIHWLL